jgi:hypothetical protein
MGEAAERAVNDPAEVVAEDGVRFLAPVPDPPSIRDFYAFEEHVKTSARALGREVSPVWYEIPLFYFTNPAATRGPYDDIPIAPGSARFDYELEIAAGVGRLGSDLDPAAAAHRRLHDHVRLERQGPAGAGDEGAPGPGEGQGQRHQLRRLPGHCRRTGRPPGRERL